MELGQDSYTLYFGTVGQTDIAGELQLVALKT